MTKYAFKYRFQSRLDYLEKHDNTFNVDDLKILCGDISLDIKDLKRNIDKNGMSNKQADREVASIINAMCMVLGYNPYAQNADEERIKISKQKLCYGRQMMQFFVRKMFDNEINLAPIHSDNKRQINNLVYKKSVEPLHSGRPINLEEAETENPIWIKNIINAYAMWDESSKERFCSIAGLRPDDTLIPNGTEDDAKRDEVWRNLRSHNYLLRPLAELKYFSNYTFMQESTVEKLFDTSCVTERHLANIFPYQDIENGFYQVYQETEALGDAGQLKNLKHTKKSQNEFSTLDIYLAKSNKSQVIVDRSAEDSSSKIENLDVDVKPTTQDDTDGGQGVGGQGGQS